MNWNSSCDPDPVFPKSVPDLTEARVSKWECIPGVMFHHLVVENQEDQLLKPVVMKFNKHIWGCLLDVYILLTIYLCSHMTKHLISAQNQSTLMTLKMY